MWRGLALLAASISTAGCMRTITTEVPLAPVREDIVLAPAVGSVLRSQFTFDAEQRRLQGHVAWAATCRRAVVARGRARQVTTIEPNREAGIAAALGALGAGIGSAVLIAHRDAFSSAQSCNEDGSCASPRGGADALAVVLGTTAVALTATSIVTLAKHPKPPASEIVLGPPGAPEVVEAGISCGKGSVDGLGVLVYQGTKRVAAGTTDANGDVLIPLAPGLGGQVTVVAAPASWRYELVAPTEVLSAFDLPK